MLLELCSSYNSSFSLFDRYGHVNYNVIDCYLKTIVDPLICGTGFVVNSFCLSLFLIVSYRHRNQNSELLPYLAGLCFFDAMQNILTVTVLDVQAWAQHLQYRYPFQPDQWTMLKTFSSYSLRYLGPIIYTVNFASIWTITAIAIERWRAICNPWTAFPKHCSAERHCNNSCLYVLLILVVALLLNSVRWWESQLHRVSLKDFYVGIGVPEFDGFAVNDSFSDVLPTLLSTNELYSLIMNKVVYAAFVYGIPFIMLIVLNGLIFWTLYIQPIRDRRNSMRQMKAPTPRKSNGSGRRQSSAIYFHFNTRHREMRSAWMLITIIALFFLCHTGGLLIRFIPRDWIFHNQALYYTVVDINNLLFNINSLLNPVVYFLFTKKFKDFWKLSFGPPADALKKSAHGITHAAVMTLLTTHGSVTEGYGAPKRSVILRKLNSDAAVDYLPATPNYRSHKDNTSQMCRFSNAQTPAENRRSAMRRMSQSMEDDPPPHPTVREGDQSSLRRHSFGNALHHQQQQQQQAPIHHLVTTRIDIHLHPADPDDDYCNGGAAVRSVSADPRMQPTALANGHALVGMCAHRLSDLSLSSSGQQCTSPMQVASVDDVRVHWLTTAECLPRRINSRSLVATDVDSAVV